MSEITKEPRISDGTACILVKDKCLKGDKYIEYVEFLRSEGFTLKRPGKGKFDGVDWIYVNIQSKMYAHGMPGIPVTAALCNHAVTMDEFMCIYNIYKKYEGTPPLAMN